MAPRIDACGCVQCPRPSSGNRFRVDKCSVADPQDIVDIDGIRSPATRDPRSRASSTKRFLSVWFRCCHTYGRMNRNRAETAYEGRCPRCGAKVRAHIGPGGTTRRVFEAG